VRQLESSLSTAEACSLNKDSRNVATPLYPPAQWNATDALSPIAKGKLRTERINFAGNAVQEIESHSCEFCSIRCFGPTLMTRDNASLKTTSTTKAPDLPGARYRSSNSPCFPSMCGARSEARAGMFPSASVGTPCPSSWTAQFDQRRRDFGSHLSFA